MKKFIGLIVLAFWVVGALLLTPGVSSAQVLPPGIQIFDDDTSSPGISVVTSGSLLSSNLVITRETTSLPGSVFWDFSYYSNSNRAQPETFSYNIFEQGATPAVLSDTLLITLTPRVGPAVVTTLGHLEFYSGPLDDTPLLTALPNATPIFETGALQDLLVPGIPHPTDMLVLQFQSDLDATSVPEPMSPLLLGAGLVGMAVIGRKSRKDGNV